ncbi:MAG TPA: Holliday junction ATP-dependent DNA helicase RuvA [Caldisericia bacterium]|nr:Holliday junction ATP-dependent DNA helicase RuvA [Caldisericia bacterium]HPF49483.1 Holliday junction ATP-dependent DNA helicase RuvA [Caldisericia bacterium]HPI84223.1 Holliday junction ATP-dependent DNA helicase RuvA [Caldisericia bacterium]HPQ93482.1 Holliday junction ATP-dependent DNA helicase RuvA [Caldisericia bacterium]HRV75512.1 Holliday junction ATP-dependent DNA helicase RuvA [Caldisericia bacterium]
MIAHLEGRIDLIDDEFIVIDVGGMGYRVFHGNIEGLQLGRTIKVHIVYQQKEDGVTLFGFGTSQEANLMRTIQGRVSGVGGKSALMILRTLTPSQIADAVINERPDVFKTVHGIGKKTSERIVLELRDVMSQIPIGVGVERTTASSAIDDARAALRALGFTIGEVEKALDGIGKELSSEEIITAALEKLGR